MILERGDRFRLAKAQKRCLEPYILCKKVESAQAQGSRHFFVQRASYQSRSAQHPLFTILASRHIAQLLSDPLNLLTQANYLSSYLLQRFLDLLTFFPVIHVCTTPL